MAKIRLTSPTFDASAQTITHTSFSDVTLAGIQLIVNVTDQVIIYNFADPTKGGSLTGDVLTLEFDTTTMDDTDQLMVLVEDGVAYQIPTGAATAANQASILAAVDGLEALLTTIDADTGAILAAVDTLETLVASTNTKLDTVIGHVDGVETAIASTNTKLDTLITQTDGLEASNSAIQTAVEAIDNAIAGNEMQVDVVTLPSVNFTDLFITGQGSQTAINQNIILASAGSGSYDTMGTTGQTYRSIAIQIVPAAGTVTAGTVVFEGSNDDTNWASVFLVDQANITAIPVATYTLAASTPRYFKGQVTWRYFRARLSVGVTGTTTGVQAHTVFSTIPYTDTRLTVSQATAASLNVTASVASISSSVTPGTAASNLGKARDVAAGGSDTGVAQFMIRRDAPTAVTPAAGDYELPQISNLGAQYVHPVAHTAGGATPYKLVSAATTNATSVKASAGQVYNIVATNSNAAARYLKLYNLSSAPTVGTSTPVQVYMLPANGGVSISLPTGMAFSTGIALATTTGAADSDTGAVALSEIVVNLSYL